METKPTILIVDDDQVSLSLLSKLVEQLKYRVLLAKDGVEAFEILHNETIDLIISDYEMPRMTGLELLTKVKDEFPRLPFILVTAHSELSVIREAWDAGAFDFFQKPVYVDRLHQTVRLAVEYGHLAMARRKFAKSEETQPDPTALNTGVIRELALALNQGDLLKIVEEFEIHARIELENIFRYSMAKDSNQVKVYAHRLKGTATNLGLIRVAEKLKTIEKDPNAPIANANELSHDLEQSIQWLKQSVTQIFKNIAS